MNYEKRNAKKKQKQISSRANMTKKKAGVRLFQGFLIFMLLLCVVGVVGGVVIIKNVVEDAPAITPESIKPQGFTSIVYADDGKTETDRLKQAGSNREYKTIDQIPVDLQHAFVAIEDSRFYEHKGIDPQGIIRAAVVGVTNGFNFTEGASTITQQLIKNNVFPDFINERGLDKYKRKLQEQYLALQIEKQLSKDDILESYMNTINLGQNTLGVQAASQRYFGKDVSELTLSESATIAGITKNPSGYNPITNPEANNDRRKKVLGDMLAQGYIDQEQHDDALEDNVYDRIQTVNNQIQEESSIMSYFNDALVEQLIDDFTSTDGLGYTGTQAANAVYSGGLSIYSTQNTKIQRICEKELERSSNFPSDVEWGLDYALTVTRADGTQENYSTGHVVKFGKEEYNDSTGHLFSSKDQAKSRIKAFKKSVSKKDDAAYDEYYNLSPQPQASVCVIEQSTGQIKALVGGRGKKTTNRGLNRAYTGAAKQPGSCFKILAVYAPALDSAGLTLATVRTDEPYRYQTGSKKAITNAYSGYLGDITLRKAIEQSCNIVAVKVLNEISIDLGYGYCKNFGISTLSDENDKVESLALGGTYTGVYNYEITAAYAAIANEGVYIEPILYTKVLDHDGNVLLNNEQDTKKVIKETTAALLISAMQDVVDSGTAYNAALRNMDVAGKSGTSSNRKDYWFCGFTPYYTMSIWLGYDVPQEMPSYTWNYHFKIWAKIMDQINDKFELPYESFEMPDTLVKRSICARSGLMASDGCSKKTSDWFAKDSIPNEYCSKCAERTKEICKKSGLLASDACEETKEKYFSNKKDIPKGTCTECKKEEETVPEVPPTDVPTDPDTPSDPGNTGGDTGNGGGDTGTTPPPVTPPPADGGTGDSTGGGADSGTT